MYTGSSSPPENPDIMPEALSDPSKSWQQRSCKEKSNSREERRWSRRSVSLPKIWVTSHFRKVFLCQVGSVWWQRLRFCHDSKRKIHWIKSTRRFTCPSTKVIIINSNLLFNKQADGVGSGLRLRAPERAACEKGAGPKNQYWLIEIEHHWTESFITRHQHPSLTANGSDWSWGTIRAPWSEEMKRSDPGPRHRCKRLPVSAISATHGYLYSLLQLKKWGT